MACVCVSVCVAPELCVGGGIRLLTWKDSDSNSEMPLCWPVQSMLPLEA